MQGLFFAFLAFFAAKLPRFDPTCFMLLSTWPSQPLRAAFERLDLLEQRLDVLCL